MKQVLTQIRNDLSNNIIPHPNGDLKTFNEGHNSGLRTAINIVEEVLLSIDKREALASTEPDKPIMKFIITRYYTTAAHYAKEKGFKMGEWKYLSNEYEIKGHDNYELYFLESPNTMRNQDLINIAKLRGCKAYNIEGKLL